MDEGSFDMDIAMLPGVSLAKAMEVNQQAAAKLKKFDELDTIVGRTGQTGVALDTRGLGQDRLCGDFQAEERMETGYIQGRADQ